MDEPAISDRAALTRAALALGAVAAGGGAAFTAFVPPDWMAAQLAIAEDVDATAFLLRRFAASASAGLGAAALLALRGHEGPVVALTGLSAWFGVQAATALVGLAAGDVGGVARFSAVFDPAMAALFGVAAVRAGQQAT